MHLSPREQEKLLVVVAADLARRRQARGLKLNYPEAIAIITLRDFRGCPRRSSLAGLDESRHHDFETRRRHGRRAEMIHEVQVEATFPDGTKLVTVHNPIR